MLVASCHWGVDHDVLQYMTEIAHSAIDVGADIVVGHGPHYVLPIEVYKGKPIFYSLCNLSFHSGHRGVHGDWTGLLVCITLQEGKLAGGTFQLMRHNDKNETFITPLGNEDRSGSAGRHHLRQRRGARDRAQAQRRARRDRARAPFHGLGTPSNTPAEIIETLNKEISAGLADPKIKARLAD